MVALTTYQRSDLAIPGGASWGSVDQYVVVVAITPTANKVLLANTDGTFTLIEGTGFTFVGPQFTATGGTVTTITRITTNTFTPAPGDILETITDVSTPTLQPYPLVTLMGEMTQANSTAFPANVLGGDNFVFGGTLADTLSGFNGHDNIQGGGGADTMSGGAGNDILDGGTGADVMTGGAGNDIYVVDDAFDSVVETAVGDGTDEVRSSLNFYLLGDNLDNLTFDNGVDPDIAFNAIGNTLANKLTGGDLADILVGNGGNDTLDGKGGGDNMQGGDGNDTYVVDNTGDFVIETGTGTDTVISTIGFAAGPGRLILAANIENLTYDNGDTADLLTDPTDDDDQFFADGNGLNNIITGGYHVDGDVLNGLGGNDAIDGLDGGDVIDGGDGNDTLRGGAGLDTLTGGIGNDSLDGGADGDTLNGGDGNDTLDGGSNGDTMNGGAGDDTYIVDDASDIVDETILGSSGIDTVRSSVTSWSLNVASALDVENLIYDNGVAADVGFSGQGNTLGNTITGGNAASGDELYGREGADTLNGLDGNDYLEGDDGNDTINGGAGNDQLDGSTLDDDGRDTLRGGGGNDVYRINHVGDQVIEDAGAGTDQVILLDNTSIGLVGTGLRALAGLDAVTAYTLGANLEGLDYQGAANFTLTGNNLDNQISGSSGNDTIDGSTGADSLFGDSGNDTYVVDNAGDNVFEDFTGGSDIDEVRSKANVYGLLDGQEIEKLTYIGAGNFIGFGNDFANDITGGTGNDRLDGGLGGDSLRGLGGNDSYVVDSGDTVFEELTGGTDTIFTASTSYSLNSEQLANVENLTYDNGNIILFPGDVDPTNDDDSFVGTGNDLNNVITGGYSSDALSGEGGNDLLDGKGEADSLVGGLGNDTYVIDNSGDVITEIAGEGTADTVSTSLASYTLAAELENLAFIGAGTFAGTGNAAANVLTGGASNDTLFGLGGNDTLQGGGGNDSMGGGIGDDTYVVDSASDVAFEVAGQGTADTVRTSVSYAVYFGWDIETLETTNAAGVGALNLTGSANANTITGNAGANILNGGAGVDTLIGLAGNDFYMVDNGLDVITEALGGGTADHVRTTVSFALAFDDDVEFLETVTPAAATALNLFGNDVGQVITGNAGVNVINARGGNDVIVSGYGNDIVAGGLGNDVFRFNALINAAGNRDTITDFNVVNDTMQLENTGAGLFTLLPAGGLAAALFKANATGTATDADDRIVYNTATGALFYDINGSAAGGATQFATIANKAALTNADFVII